MNLQHIKHKDTVVKLLSFFSFAYPILFIWQGIDVTDTGYLATNYHFFFEMLEAGNTNSLIFLTNLIGALWLKTFPFFGLLGLSILYLLFLIGIIIFSNQLLKLVSDDKLTIWIGIAIGVIFFTRYSSLIFSYSICSWLFLTITAFTLCLHFHKNSLKYLSLAGAFFALAILARFPNIVMLVFIPAVFLFEHNFKFNKQTILSILKKLTVFTIGLVFIFLILLLVLYITDYINNYVKGFSFLKGIKNESTSTQNTSHSLSTLIRTNITDIRHFIPTLVAVFFIMIGTLLLFNAPIKIKPTYKKTLFSIFVILFFYISFLEYRHFGYSNKLKYLVPAICAPLFLYALFYIRKIRLLLYIILIISITHVAGTNTGVFLKLYYAQILWIPLALIILSKIETKHFSRIQLNTKPVAFLIILFIPLLSAYNRVGYIYHEGQGVFIRMKIIHPVEKVEKLKFNYTAKSKAAELTKLVTTINQYVKKGDQLYVYGHKPLLYYLTDNQPAIKEIFLANNKFEAETIFKALNGSIDTQSSTPVILNTKEKILGEQGEILLNEFIDHHNYTKVYSNESFEIWKKVE